MKILFLSDLHNEFSIFESPTTKADVVVLTGDIDICSKGAVWALETFESIPIIYILGNHEYYGHKLPKVNDDLLKLSNANSNLYFLENEKIVIDSIRFIGCTLWTDFLLFGPENLNLCCDHAEQSMTDFTRIRLGPSNSYRKLRAADVIRIHKESIRFLEKQLSKNFDGITIILSHHAPLKNSIPEKFKSDLLSGAFSSNLKSMISKFKPEYWLHGHTHFNVNYVFDATRIISNQRGYYPMELVDGFKENYILEIN